MAFFKFRFPGKGGAPEGRRRNGQAQAPKGLVRKSQAAQTESVDSLRQRARHRVIGASVLVVLAVLGFPMVFDTEPRPVGYVPLAVPDRNEVSITPGHMAPIVRVPHEDSLLANEEVVSGSSSAGPLDGAVVAAVATGTAAAVGLANSAPNLPAQRSLAEQNAETQALAKERAAQAERDRAAEQLKAEREKAEQLRQQREQAAKDKAAKDKAEREKAAKDKAAREKAAKDKAEREKRQAEARAERTERQAKERADRAEREKTERAKSRDDDTGRFVIQVGSFADEEKAKAARTKLERAGITTYIQVLNTKDGKRTRVRVGPFGSRAEADAAAKRVQGLGLYAGIAEL